MNNKIEQKKSGFSRRNFIKTGAITSALFGTGALLPACANTHTESKNGQKNTAQNAKNVIILVSDGMSIGTLSMADHFLRLKENRASYWIDLYEKGKVSRGLMDMASANSLVTDSAAAGSSWGCGFRVPNGYINIGENGESHKPINLWFKEAGKATGCVTTTRITHATPAAFCVNIAERWLEDKIAEQYLERKFDVLLGGGIEHFSNSKREDGRDLIAEFKDKGFHFVQKRNKLLDLTADDKPIMGVFTESHLPYTIDHLNDNQLKEDVPTLAELTESALKKLSQNSNGFILQVEGGRVDHAAHINDVGGIIYDQIALDDAIKVALDFANKDKETLVIITTDHGNASPCLVGIGSGYGNSNPKFERLLNFKQSNDWMMKKINENASRGAVKEIVYQGTGGIEITNEEADLILKGKNRNYQFAFRDRWSFPSALADVLANYTAVTWANNQHTSDFVELAAFGPGSERIAPITRNTELFQLITQVAGVKTDVPSMAELTSG